jgi:5-methylcytosine-specific restriction endonuclease McrA
MNHLKSQPFGFPTSTIRAKREKLMETKICSKCGRELPATSEYFPKRTTTKLQSRCKECASAYYKQRNARPDIKEKSREQHREWRHNNVEKSRDAAKRHRQKKRENNPKPPKDNSIKLCHKCGRYLPATTEYFYANKRYKEPFRSPCKECLGASVNKEEKAAYNKKYKETHKEELREYQRRYWVENKERKQEYKRARQEYFTAKHREYVEKNRDRVMANSRKWEIANRNKRNEQARTHAINRRLRKYRNGGKLSRSDIDTQYNRQKGKCYYCGEKVGKKYHVDHVVPLSRGGSHSPDNIVIACPTCNLRKNNKLPHEWLEGGRLL